jgi:hypothetical protein
MKYKLKARMIAALIVAATPCATIAESAPIVHDAEYRILERQLSKIADIKKAQRDARLLLRLCAISSR